MSCLTLHSLRAIPMHNLNRDQNGLPKSQFDGGIQRGRISSQAIKRPARIAFRAAIAGLPDAPSSVRTMDTKAVQEVVIRAAAIATARDQNFDPAAAKKAARSVILGLAKSSKVNEDKAAENQEVPAPVKDSNAGEGKAVEDQETSGAAPAKKDSVAKKDNILLFSDAELDTFAAALVDAQEGGDEPTVNDFIQDFSSPSLDVAAFGRMFAARTDLSTQAAVAVSHAVMTHEMSLTIDYFTAVDELADAERPDAGAGHLGLAYYTSGVYYSSFTIDPAQLRRSWSAFGATSARDQVGYLVKALLEALPTGRLSNTNAHTNPFLVLAENQKRRTVYEFETPVQADGSGGYKDGSVKALCEQYNLARTYDADSYLDTVIFAPGVSQQFDGAVAAESIHDLVDRVVGFVFEANP